MPDPVSGIGAQFRRWNSGTGAWEKISLITKIVGPDSKRDTLDTTSLDTTGGYRTFLGGLRDGGSVKLSMQFSRDTWETMRADFESDTLQNYEIVLPDADNTSREFQGFVTEVPLNIDEKIITADVTIKISGQPTVNSGSGPSPG